MLTNHTRSILFPYTTLFRSAQEVVVEDPLEEIPRVADQERQQHAVDHQTARLVAVDRGHRDVGHHGAHRAEPEQHRSEEHTSELQSHSDLVCRLLLEKKKET